jgi:hypothetical protein
MLQLDGLLCDVLHETKHLLKGPFHNQKGICFQKRVRGLVAACASAGSPAFYCQAPLPSAEPRVVGLCMSVTRL